MACRPAWRYLGAMKHTRDPLYARVQALPMPQAQRELAAAWLAQAEMFAALAHAISTLVAKLTPARSAQGPRSSSLRPTA